MEISNIIVSHQKPEQVERMLEYWGRLLPSVRIIIAFGGTRQDFDGINHVDKIYVDDPRLRTRDHQRECQSYAGIFGLVSEFLVGQACDYIYFTEYDHIPLSPHLHEYLLGALKDANADVLLQQLKRVDGTNHPHYLFHQGKGGLLDLLSSISVREDKSVVLSAVGFGQFWKRDAFDAVASVKDEAGCYLELWQPSVAHHLGYRVSGFLGQEEYNGVKGDITDKLLAFAEQGVWSAHPSKKLWDSDRSISSQLDAVIAEACGK